MKKNLVDKIKTRGYWQVIIKPQSFNKEYIENIGYLKDIVRETRVSFRGWEYPYFGYNYQPEVGLDFIEHHVEWKYFLEYWRYYQSGQFIHFFGMIEDWQDQVSQENKLDVNKNNLSIISTLYIITEIYEFASRLASKGFLSENCSISINLYNTNGRKLITLDRSRHLSNHYISSIENIEIPTKEIRKTDLIANSKELAINETVWLFERFQWDKPPGNIFREEQEKLIKGLT